MVSKQHLWAIGVLLSATIGVFWYVASQLAPRGIAVRFLDVGQGDAHLVSTRRVNVLIDTGPSSRAANELDRIMPMGNRTIDIVLISHPNVDHFYGLMEIVKRYRVRLVLVSGVLTDDAKYGAVLASLKERGIPMLYSRQGQTITWEDARFKILWPDFQYAFGERIPESKLNDASLVALLSYGNFDALFTGDISATVEKKLAGVVHDIELLKVGHHGSRYSSSALFLDALRPEIAVIPVGENRYGHPSGEVLERLGAYAHDIFDTLARGTVTVLSDGIGYAIHAER